MARMKIEVQAARLAKQGLTLRDRLIGYLPRYAPLAARFPRLANLRNRHPRLRQWSERYAGLSARRELPRWRADAWREAAPFIAPAPSLGGGSTRAASAGARRKEVVFFADTFNRYFEPENVADALAVLAAGGYGVHLPKPQDRGRRPLCCGRTFLAVGLIEQARLEAARSIAALAPFVADGIAVVGLEPSCLLGFRDEIPALLGSEAAKLVATRALLFEEFVAQEAQAGTLVLPLRPVAARALLHGHCHQKSFGVMPAVETTLKLVPELDLARVESSCCGMAGAFGYAAETIDISLQMAELSLLPAMRKAETGALVVADGISCRQQIRDGSGRAALHAARVLAMALPSAKAKAA
jgi:Fe-S oxidoreductase